MTSNEQALKNLKEQQEQAKTVYIKLTGAVEVLTELVNNEKKEKKSVGKKTKS
mgnify:CR=1 FL=1